MLVDIILVKNDLSVNQFCNDICFASCWKLRHVKMSVEVELYIPASKNPLIALTN